MKAVLVIDVPKTCEECPVFTGHNCMIPGEHGHRYGDKPPGCPAKTINPNMIKALRCIASQDAMKDCYRTRYNRDRKEGEPLMTCKPLPDDLSIPCPYQQDEYKTNCEDGECMGWLNEIADMLEGKYEK